MAKDWSKIAAKVDKALAGIQDTTSPAKGRGFIVRDGTASGPAYDPTPGTPTEYACNVLYSDFTVMEIDGTLIEATDLKVVIGATELTIVPTEADKFKDSDGKEYEIKNVDPLRPAGVVVLYELQCRA